MSYNKSVYGYDDQGNVSNLDQYMRGSIDASGMGGETVSAGEGSTILKSAVDSGMTAQQLVDSANSATGNSYTLDDLQSYVKQYFPNTYGDWSQGKSTTATKYGPQASAQSAAPQASGSVGGSLNKPPRASYTPAKAHTGEVTPEQTASFQLQQLLDSNSPYIQQAFRIGERRAARRGGVNSSIAGGNAVAEAL
jgi:hypothetical protein